MPNLIFLKGNNILKNQDTFTYKNHHENTNLDIFVTAAFLNFKKTSQFLWNLHCKYLSAWFECNDIGISVYSHYSLDTNAKSSDTKGTTLSDDFAFRLRG